HNEFRCGAFSSVAPTSTCSPLTLCKQWLTVSNGLRRSTCSPSRPNPAPHPRGVARTAKNRDRVGDAPAGEPARRVAAPEGAGGGEAGARRATRQSPRVFGEARRSGRAAAVPGELLVRGPRRVQRGDRATHKA